MKMSLTNQSEIIKSGQQTILISKSLKMPLMVCREMGSILLLEVMHGWFAGISTFTCTVHPSHGGIIFFYY